MDTAWGGTKAAMNDSVVGSRRSPDAWWAARSRSRGCNPPERPWDQAPQTLRRAFPAPRQPPASCEVASKEKLIAGPPGRDQEHRRAALAVATCLLSEEQLREGHPGHRGPRVTHCGASAHAGDLRGTLDQSHLGRPDTWRMAAPPWPWAFHGVGADLEETGISVVDGAVGESSSAVGDETRRVDGEADAVSVAATDREGIGGSSLPDPTVVEDDVAAVDGIGVGAEHRQFGEMAGFVVGDQEGTRASGLRRDRQRTCCAGTSGVATNLQPGVQARGI